MSGQRRGRRARLAGTARYLAVLVTLLAVPAAAASARSITVVAPPILQTAADEIRNIDLQQTEAVLRRAGLSMPPDLTVTLIPESDPQASRVPRWVVGLALEPQDIVILPQRVLPYPYDSLTSVFRHEVAHLALSARSGGRPVPRWFHEGVAVSLDGGWSLSGRARLFVETLSDPSPADLTRLFASNTEPDAARAYGLATALVADIQQRQGFGVPGAIAAHVAEGVPFDTAFEMEIGETPDAAAARAWVTYRRWARWTFLASNTGVWGLILALAVVAFFAQRVRRQQRRQRWAEEEDRI